jgi:hypothetical protein
MCSVGDLSLDLIAEGHGHSSSISSDILVDGPTRVGEQCSHENCAPL